MTVASKMDEDALATVLGLLNTVWRLHTERPDKPCTLARLAKHAGLPMSVLRRQLLPLADAGWVTVLPDEGGVSGTVCLTAAGAALCQQLHG